MNNVWNWLKQPLHPKFPIPRLFVVIVVVGVAAGAINHLIMGTPA